MKYDVEQLLQQALSPIEEPEFWLNQKILQIAKETEHMTKRKTKLPAGIVAAVLTLIVASVGVFAGWKYLAPEKVAEEVFADELLSKAFQTEDAILINETQECAGYRFTLLGIVSGKGLSEYTDWDEQGNIVDERTYVITAIENADGTPRPDVSDEAYGQDTFYVSPYIKGLSMTDYNAHTLGGGYSEDVVDGIQYRILECDNVEMFAKRGIYLGINEGSFYDSEAFVMDSVTGEIITNEAYEGVNAVFELPIPAFKGDEAAAEAYIKEKMAAENAAEETGLPEEAAEDMSEVETVAAEVSKWTLEDFLRNAECIIEKELVPDEKGYISYSYQVGDGGGSEAATLVDMLFEDKQPGFSEYMSIFGENPTYIETFELLENGNVKLRVFAI